MALKPEEMKQVGGSDVAAIVGVNPYAGPLSLYLRIVEGVEQEGGTHASRGNRLEGPLLDWYEEYTGRRAVRKVALRDERRPHRRASLDALSWESDDSPARPVEAKTANLSQVHLWGEEGTDAIPPQYIAQTQFYLGHGRELRRDIDDVADVPALVGGDFRLYRVRHDPEVYGLLSEAVERFWVDHVLARRPPDATALPRDVEAVQKRFRRHEGDAPLDFSALPPEAQVTLEEYLRSYAEESAAADRLATWEARAKMVVGAAPGVRGLPEVLGWSRIDWKAQKGKPAWKAVAEALAKQHGVSPEQLARLAAENTGEGPRPFTPRPITKRESK